MNPLKVTIWTLAIVGLIPAILLAILTLSSNIALARHLKKEAELQIDEGEFTSSLSYIEFDKKYRLEVATSNWPSVTLLVGAVGFVVGLIYMIPPQMQLQQVHGFDEIEEHVAQVLDSPSPHAYLVISPASDEYTGLTVSNGEEGRFIEFYLTKKEQIAPILAFFAERGVEPVSDYVTEEGTGFETRHLSFPANETTKEVAELCESILADVYGTEKDAELVFTVGG